VLTLGFCMGIILHTGLKDILMAQIETIEENGSKSYVGVVEFDDCTEVMDNFDGEIQGDRFVIENSDGVIEKLFRDDLIDRSEKEALENCDYLAFTGVKS